MGPLAVSTVGIAALHPSPATGTYHHAFVGVNKGVERFLGESVGVIPAPPPNSQPVTHGSLG